MIVGSRFQLFFIRLRRGPFEPGRISIGLGDLVFEIAHDVEEIRVDPAHRSLHDISNAAGGVGDSPRCLCSDAQSVAT